MTGSDMAAAARIATAAGRKLIEVRSEIAPGPELKAVGDRASQVCIMEMLAAEFPSDAVLSEEAPDDSDRLTNRRVWVVDPLDGTREFSEPPREDWAVHVALVEDGVLTGGAVALPSRGITVSSEGSFPPPSTYSGPARILVSRTRPTEHASALAERLGGELVPLGSAGAKAMAVVFGEADIYAHSGGQYEWDSAAPVAVAAAAGLHVSRLDGSPLAYNQPEPWLPDVLICRPELAGKVIEICAVVKP